jgi:hypothetical protein
MKKDALITALSIVLASAALSVSCREGAGRTPTVPTQSGAQRVTVSGLVFESTPQGDRPIAGAEFEIHTLIGFTVLGTVSSDAEGRYMVSNLAPGITIALSRSSGSFHLAQQCVASTTVGADNVLDVELGSVYPSARLSRSPVVSGLIFERTAAARQPVPNAQIYYDWDCGDGNPEAGIASDANGRYELCRLPRGGCVDVFLRDGRFASRSVDAQRDTVLDIEVPASMTSTSAAPR